MVELQHSRTVRSLALAGYTAPTVIAGGNPDREQRTDEPVEVAVYVRAFEELRRAALVGDDATALIRHVMAELRHGRPRPGSGD